MAGAGAWALWIQSQAADWNRPALAVLADPGRQPPVRRQRVARRGDGCKAPRAGRGAGDRGLASPLLRLDDRLVGGFRAGTDTASGCRPRLGFTPRRSDRVVGR